MLDGSTAVVPDLAARLVNNVGTASTGGATTVRSPHRVNVGDYRGHQIHSYYRGLQGYSFGFSGVRVIYIPENLPPDPDNDGVINAPTNLALESGTTHLLIGTDGTIFSRLFVQWAATTDERAIGYELQYKKSSDSTWLFAGDVLGRSTAQSYIAPIQDGIDYDVRVRASDQFRATSNWLTATNHTAVGKTAPPEDVISFVAMQNGNVVVFRWNQVADVDLAGYEIRYGPLTETSWEDATPLTKVTKGTTITSAAIPPGTWRTYIKAVDTSGNYSASAVIADIEYINTFDIVEQRPQAPGWPGSLTNFVKHWTGVLLPDDQNMADTYTNFEWCDQFVPTPFDQCIYESLEIDIGFDDVVRIWGDVISALGPGVMMGEAAPQLQIDYRKNADVYGGWRDWDVGNVEAQYIKYRLVLDTTIGKAKVTGFRPTADQLEDTVKIQNVAITAGGSVVTYPREFHRIPIVKVNVQGGSALFATRENINTTQCTVHVWDTSGVDVGGIVDIEVTGV